MTRYVRITPEQSENVIHHLRHSFFADEPLNKAMALVEKGQSHAALERLCYSTIADGLSLAAIEDDTILGVALNGTLRPGDVERSLELTAQSSDEKYNKIFSILYTTSRDLNLFKRFDVDTILECRIVSVSEKARGRGLAKELMRRSIDIAKEQGFKGDKVHEFKTAVNTLAQSNFPRRIIGPDFTFTTLSRTPKDSSVNRQYMLFKVDATSLYSYRICSSLGMKLLKEVSYSEYCDVSGTPVFNVDPPHEALSVMILEIP